MPKNKLKKISRKLVKIQSKAQACLTREEAQKILAKAEKLNDKKKEGVAKHPPV